MRFYITDYHADYRVREPLRWHRHPGSMVHFLLKDALERISSDVREQLLGAVVPHPSPHPVLRVGAAAPAALIPVLPRVGSGPRGPLQPGDTIALRVRRFGRADRRVDQCVIDSLEAFHPALVADAIGRRGPRERPVTVDDRPTSHTRASLRFHTPAHIQSAGEIREDLAFGALVSNIRRRLEALCALHGELPAGASESFRALRALTAEVRRTRSTLRRETWRRETSAPGGDRTTHPMVGLLGELDFEGPLGPFAATLAAAELAHVGKMTSMGLGHIAVHLGGAAHARDSLTPNQPQKPGGQASA